MKFLVTEEERQICLIADNIILEDDGVYYAWDDLNPHKVTRANSTSNLEIVDVPEGTNLPESDYIISKYCYTEDGEFVIYPEWNEDDI
jgi:hypothetical protein